MKWTRENVIKFGEAETTRDIIRMMQSVDLEIEIRMTPNFSKNTASFSIGSTGTGKQHSKI
jgi:hypothetical protein